jgi:DNA-binding transcriptional MerR regulator
MLTSNTADKTVKPPLERRFRIGELIRHTPFSRQTIHNYTIMGLIKESEWTEGGHRLYDESVFDRLAMIARLKETKSLSEIRHLLCHSQTDTPTPETLT